MKRIELNDNEFMVLGEFLKRVTLQGQEVSAFVNLTNKFNSAITIDNNLKQNINEPEIVEGELK